MRRFFQSRGWRVLFGLGVLLGGLAGLAGLWALCAGNCGVRLSNWFAPQAGSVSLGLLVGAALIFCVAEALLLLATVRLYREVPDAPGGLGGDMLWTAMPAVLLAILFVFTARRVLSAPLVGASPVVRVTAIGHLWWWEFQYPDLGLTTANELVLPLGAPVEVTLQSADVTHGFWAPELFGQVDALPGVTNHVRFTLSDGEAAAYGGVCTRACGARHADMRFLIDARSPADFQTWVDEQRAPAAEGGQTQFLPAGCGECHAIRGTPAAGQAGPDLTHLMSRRTLAGGLTSNDRYTLRLWLLDPHALEPGPGLAPARALSESEAETMADYLTTLK